MINVGPRYILYGYMDPLGCDTHHELQCCARGALRQTKTSRRRQSGKMLSLAGGRPRP